MFSDKIKYGQQDNKNYSAGVEFSTTLRHQNDVR